MDEENSVHISLSVSNPSSIIPPKLISFLNGVKEPPPPPHYIALPRKRASLAGRMRITYKLHIAIMIWISALQPLFGFQCGRSGESPFTQCCSSSSYGGSCSTTGELVVMVTMKPQHIAGIQMTHKNLIRDFDQ